MDADTPLQIFRVDLHVLDNAKVHNTYKFELVHEDEPIPVLRRGVDFVTSVRFEPGSRPFDVTRDVVRFIFEFGTAPNPLKGTKGVVRIDPRVTNSNHRQWSGEIKDLNRDGLNVKLRSPSECPVGKWRLKVETAVRYSSKPSLFFKFPLDVYILFNPWNCDDLVCMPEKRLLDEYVLTDVGKIWVGPYGSSKGREWVFGQFDKSVLLAATNVLDRSNLADQGRGDPIRVVRAISQLVNSNDDDNGVIIGNWSGDYSDGTAPSAWTGSVAILEQYLETGVSVPYGQCWVFSGVVTSLARALGIPSRVVSNLVSAHDANSSLTVDKYYTEFNEELDFDPNNPNGADSIWNYHVWNDVWMARPDLPSGHGGWQAIDATPQETSDGLYRCGPASLEAVRTGQVGLNFDVTFLIASVNADLMRWKEDKNSEMGFKRIYCNKYHIGRMILSKKPFLYDPNGDKDREDITLQYKPQEGTVAERLTLTNAARCTSSAKRFFQLPENVVEDVKFDLVELERVKIGQDYEVMVNMKNSSSSERTIRAALSTSSTFYTGIKSQVIKQAEGVFKLKPHAEQTMRLTVTADDYLDKLVEYCIMKICAIASVAETEQTWAEDDDFQVIKPSINIRIREVILLKKPAFVTLHLVNPLKKTLTGCQFHLAGPTLLRNSVIPFPDVKPSESIKVETQIVPKMVGEQTIVATFVSKELVDVTGTVKVNVSDD